MYLHFYRVARLDGRATLSYVGHVPRINYVSTLDQYGELVLIGDAYLVR